MQKPKSVTMPVTLVHKLRGGLKEGQPDNYTTSWNPFHPPFVVPQRADDVSRLPEATHVRHRPDGQIVTGEPSFEDFDLADGEIGLVFERGSAVIGPAGNVEHLISREKPAFHISGHKTDALGYQDTIRCCFDDAAQGRAIEKADWLVMNGANALVLAWNGNTCDVLGRENADNLHLYEPPHPRLDAC